VAGIEVGGSFDEAPGRAFRPLAGFIDGANRSRRQIAMTALVTQQKAGWEHPEKIAMTAPVVQQTAGRPGWRRARRLRLRRSPARAWIQPRPRLQNSKLAFLWFTYELQRRLPPDAITANAVCPGSSPPLPRRAPRVRCAG
jgi:NAD(P)-dependent dehydrogenase (short-subunit alcohol dehydrogenase family)